jgi:hypothetical protein
MSYLVECPGCQRHVRSDEKVCPFCRESVNFPELSAPELPKERLSRAASALKATLASSMVTSCLLPSAEPLYGISVPPYTGNTTSGGAPTGGATATNGGAGAIAGAANGGATAGGAGATGGQDNGGADDGGADDGGAAGEDGT